MATGPPPQNPARLRPAPPPHRAASPALRTLGRPAHAARRLVAFLARLRVIDSAQAAAAPPPLPQPLPPGVEAAAAPGLRVCRRRRRPASAMDLFGDLPEPERSPRPAAGKPVAALLARGRGPAGEWAGGGLEARGAGGGRRAEPESERGLPGGGPARVPGAPGPPPCSLRRKKGLAQGAGRGQRRPPGPLCAAPAPFPRLQARHARAPRGVRRLRTWRAVRAPPAGPRRNRCRSYGAIPRGHGFRVCFVFTPRMEGITSVILRGFEASSVPLWFFGWW